MPSLIERARKIEAFITCRPNDPRRPAALYALGHYKHQIARASPGLEPEAFLVFKQYIDDHEDDHRLGEIDAHLLYEGRDWRRIFQETPDHDLADDAAYYYYTRPRGGECEGYPSCSCSRSLQANEPFMRQFPESEYVIKCLHDIQEQCWLNIPDLNRMDAWARRHLEEDRPPFLEALKECLKLYTEKSSSLGHHGSSSGECSNCSESARWLHTSMPHSTIDGGGRTDGPFERCFSRTPQNAHTDFTA